VGILLDNHLKALHLKQAAKRKIQVNLDALWRLVHCSDERLLTMEFLDKINTIILSLCNKFEKLKK